MSVHSREVASITILKRHLQSISSVYCVLKLMRQFSLANLGNFSWASTWSLCHMQEDKGRQVAPPGHRSPERKERKSVSGHWSVLCQAQIQVGMSSITEVVLALAELFLEIDRLQLCLSKHVREIPWSYLWGACIIRQLCMIQLFFTNIGIKFCDLKVCIKLLPKITCGVPCLFLIKNSMPKM